jgi:hypothetical protein
MELSIVEKNVLAVALDHMYEHVSDLKSMCIKGVNDEVWVKRLKAVENLQNKLL